ncbi:NAD(P)-dependent dehydrogenase, short-chain alcohol dehydrogenase family [Bacteroidales bacterium 6E]|nr:NAD(P)-dependent dehydrogenase, short-chain alcohol dehydrogenase family [Bacteroidales bacterium 6E]
MANYLIIGGSSGIGKALAEKLAKAGHRVFATWHTHEVNDTIGKIVYQRLDVLNDDMAVDWLPESIDGLAYCPGSINLKPFHRIKPEEFVHDFNLQVLGAVKSIQAVLPRLKKSHSASIVLFSTVAVQRGFNFHSLIGTSKGAVEGLVRSLAAEFAPAIRVNGIAPSLTDTPLAERLVNTPEKRDANAQRHPLKRIGDPEDMANTAAFLMSAEASFITGQILHVDGGISDLKV